MTSRTAENSSTSPTQLAVMTVANSGTPWDCVPSSSSPSVSPGLAGSVLVLGGVGVVEGSTANTQKKIIEFSVRNHFSPIADELPIFGCSLQLSGSKEELL